MASFRAKLHGFDSWANMRLTDNGGGAAHPDILRGLFEGVTMKTILEQIMGKPMRRMTSFEGISKMQKMSRADWFIQGLKEVGFLPITHRIEAEYFVAAFGNQVFPVLWHVVNYDIKYCWCACPDMLSTNPSVLLATPYVFMNGTKPNPTVQTPAGQRRLDRVVKPDASSCILSMGRSVLKTTKEGRRLVIEDLTDFTDCRILCALINAFVPELFTSEVMLNDRWTLNLIIRSLKTLFRTHVNFDSQDFTDGEETGLCCFLTVFFTKGFQLRQSLAVLTKLEHYEKKLESARKELVLIPSTPKSTADIARKGVLGEIVNSCETEIKTLSSRFSLDHCRQWSGIVDQLQADIRDEVSEKVRQRFDIVEVEDEGMTINEFVDTLGINLTLSGGNGFYASESREVVYPGRRLVVLDVKTGEFYDNFTGSRNKDGRTVYSLLGIKYDAVSDVRADLLDGLKVFFESSSRNRILRAGSEFLYQVFPGTRKSSQRLFLNAAKIGDAEMIKKLTLFYNFDADFINCRDASTGNTALHLTARHGHEELVQYLLANGAAVNVRNTFANTPLFLGAEKIHKPICQLLLEWGADATARNRNSCSVIDLIVNSDLRRLIQQYAAYYRLLRSSLSKETQHDNSALCQEVLTKCLTQHCNADDPMQFASLESRCVSGQTLLHIAAAINDTESIKMLLASGASVGVLDSHDRTPLHCCNNLDSIEVLLNSGAPTDQLDCDGNAPLHSVCSLPPFPSQLDCIRSLIDAGCDPVLKNDADLMAVHYCASHGNTKAIQLLFEIDKKDITLALLDEQEEEKPRSLIFLALDKLHFDCADWLAEEGILMKRQEAKQLVLDAFARPLTSKELLRIVKFIMDHDSMWLPSGKLARGNSTLHLTCGDANNVELLELLLTCDVIIDVQNDQGQTALHIACEANAPFLAAILIAKGADIRITDNRGLTPLDIVIDCKGWIEAGCFDENIVERLEAYEAKHSRDLVRMVTTSVRKPSRTLSMGAFAADVDDLNVLRRRLAVTYERDNHLPPHLTSSSSRTGLPSIQLATPHDERTEYGSSLAEAIGRLPRPSTRPHSRSLSAPATASSTRLPPIERLKPRSRQVVKSVIGI